MITIQSSFLPHTDADASLAFYRDVLDFEVRLDVGQGQMRWITVGPANQPDTAIVLHPAGVGYAVTDEDRETLLAMVAKGGYFGVNLATDDLDTTFAKVEAAGTNVVQKPMEQDWGARDAAFRDPAGNLIRMQQTQEGAA